MFAARLQAYSPNGSALGELPRPIRWDASVVHNDVGALTIDYSSLTAGGDIVKRAIGAGLEVAVEVWNGTDWVESRGCRFIRIKQGIDQADEAEVYRLTFASYGWLLKKAKLFGGAFSNLRRTFTAPKAGPLIYDIVAENGSRDGIYISVVGGTDNDAAGAPWPTLPDQIFNYGQEYLAMVRGFQESGALDWTTQARGLYLYLADSTALSPDLSATVQLHLGKDITEAPAEETLENLATRIGVSADAGGNVIVEEPDPIAPHGVWEEHLAVGQVANQEAAENAGEAQLGRVGRAQQQYTRGLLFRETSPIPMIDYWPGVWITAPTTIPEERVRVQQVTISYADGMFGGSVVLNDRFLEADVRRGRTLATISGGQIGSGGAPPPISVDPEADRVPSTPTGLDGVAGLVFQDSFPRGVVTFTWNPVSTGTDGGAMVISLYELQYRINGGDWQSFVGSETTTDIVNLNPGDVVDGRVRAQGARTLNASNWSTIDTVTVSGDITPPTAMSTPTIASRMGNVIVTWDGLNNIGGPMEEDFAYGEVALDDSPTPTTVVGRLTGAGSLPVQFPVDTFGQMRTARLRAIDTSGNASAWSDPSDPILIQGVTGPDMEANSVDTNILQAGAVTADKLAGLLALLSRIVAPAETGQRVEISQEGIQLYTADEDRWVNLPTDPEQSPEFRGRLEAEGLTVRQGAQFFSPLNEFAKDSVISLAEQVAAPITAPNTSSFWEYFGTAREPGTGSLGTFSMDPSQIIHASWNPGWPCYHLLQPVSGGGARLWYYNLNGTIVTDEDGPVVFDMPNTWRVTSVSRGTDGEFRMMYEAGGKWWIWDYARGSTSATAQKEYVPSNTLRDPILTMDGTDIWVAESHADGPRFRRVTTNTNPVTVAETVLSSGAPSGSASPNVFHRGTLDFGVPKFVISYPGTSSMRVYSSTGAYESANGWEPPYGTSKRAGFWDPVTSRWRTFGPEGRLYRHSAMTWTDSALDTWHLAQTFYDQVGTTHETVIGAIKTLNPKKRSWVRIQPVPVPYAGGADDPNQWRIYGKTGSLPPAIGTGMVLQEGGAYDVLTRDRSTLLLTSGTAPPTVSNFPGAAPARLISQRTFPSDATKRLLDLRGDGSGWWGTLTVDGSGNVSDTRNASASVTLSAASNTTTVTRRGDVIFINTSFQNGSLANGDALGTLPSPYLPGQTVIVPLDINTATAPIRAYLLITTAGAISFQRYGGSDAGSTNFWRGGATWIAGTP